MNIKYISPLSDLKAEIKPLFSNEYMLAFFKKFCDAIKSRTWGFKKAKNARYDAEDFLRAFFYSCDVKSYMLEFENLVIIMMICLGTKQTTKKSTSRWTNFATILNFFFIYHGLYLVLSLSLPINHDRIRAKKYV